VSVRRQHRVGIGVLGAGGAVGFRGVLYPRRMKKFLAIAAVLIGGLSATGCSSGGSDTFDVDVYLKDFNRAVPADEDDRQVEELREYFTDVDDPYCSAFKTYEQKSEDEQIIFVYSALDGYRTIIGADALGEKSLTYAIDELSRCFD
jgi:hypothetical protein